MPIFKPYALFDWDNTVRQGYTLYSWTQYLCENSMVDDVIQADLDSIRQEYLKNMISHDQYAALACSAYAKSLSGIEIKQIRKILPDYMRFDAQYLFSWTGKLFDLLYSKGIDAIVISGAPSIILEQYTKQFKLKAIYAFKEQVLHDKFTGEVAYNFGFSKTQKVSELIEEYHSRPIIAFGDSSSDIPMLNSADYAIYIGEQPNSSYINIDSTCSDASILEKIESLLS